MLTKEMRRLGKEARLWTGIEVWYSTETSLHKTSLSRPEVFRAKNARRVRRMHHPSLRRIGIERKRQPRLE